jgi:hypothetical protein
MKTWILLPGAAMATVGFVLLFSVLAGEGALDKRKQIGALLAVSSGKAGRTNQILLMLSLLLMGLGACGLFAGVAASDAARARACVDMCKERGYTKGVIGGSKTMDPKDPKRHAFVACTCTGGSNPTPLETRASDLPAR